MNWLYIFVGGKCCMLELQELLSHEALSLVSWKGFCTSLPSDEKVALWSFSEKDTTNQCLSAAWIVWVLHLYQICCFIPLAELLGLWSACNVQLVFQFVCLSIRSSLLAIQEWIPMARIGTLSDRNFKENVMVNDIRWKCSAGSIKKEALTSLKHLNVPDFSLCLMCSFNSTFSAIELVCCVFIWYTAVHILCYAKLCLSFRLEALSAHDVLFHPIR